MVKQLLYGMVLVGGLTQALIQPLVYIEYQIRKEYIVAELCKERYTTINTCDGRCFLVRKLNDAQQQESEEKERNIKPIEIKLQLAEVKGLFGSWESEVPDPIHASYYPSFYSLLIVNTNDEPPKA